MSQIKKVLDHVFGSLTGEQQKKAIDRFGEYVKDEENAGFFNQLMDIFEERAEEQIKGRK